MPAFIDLILKIHFQFFDEILGIIQKTCILYKENRVSNRNNFYFLLHGARYRAIHYEHNDQGRIKGNIPRINYEIFSTLL